MRGPGRTGRRLAVAALTIGVATWVTRAAFARTHRRWLDNEDPTGGDALGEPDAVRSVAIGADGTELAVAIAGPADATTTFVLAHCWTGDRRIWAPVARLLAEEHRVVTWDHRGHGASTIGDAGLTIDALADDVRAVLEHVDATDAVLVGHSMGGMASQAFAIRHPEVARRRLRGLALVATACDSVARTPVVKVLLPGLRAPGVTWTLALPRVGPALVRWTVGEIACISHLHAVRETFVATPASTRDALAMAMSAMDLSDGLPAIDLPVTVVSGTRDLLTPPARSRRIVELIPGARLEVIPGAGHMLPCEAPGRLAEILLASAGR